MGRRAMLINPPTGLFIREDRCQASLDGMAATTLRPPLDLAYMAAVLEKGGIECRIRDYPAEGLGMGDFKAELGEFAPQFLFISVTSFTIKDDLETCVAAKRALGDGILTVAKGAHVAVRGEDVLEGCPELDVAIRGEYEAAAGEIAAAQDLADVAGISFRDRKSGRINTTGKRPFLENLDALPNPARHLLKNDRYLRPDTGAMQTTIQACRGCPASCIFCLGPIVYGAKLRMRSPANILGELRECVDRHGIRDFFFRADTFTWNKPWVIDLCREIINEGLAVNWVCNSRVDTIDAERLEWMKRAGCYGVAFGVESGVQESLDRIGKGTSLAAARQAVRLCREQGMTTLLYFVIGLPWETEKDICRSIDFAVELGGDFTEFHLAIPFPGTELRRIAERDGLLARDVLDGYDYGRSTLKTHTLSTDDLLRLRRTAFRRLYLRPSALFRSVRAAFSHVRTPLQFAGTLRFGVAKLMNLFSSKRSG